MIILTAAFGVLAVRDYLSTRKQKKAVVDELPSVQAEAPVRQLKAK